MANDKALHERVAEALGCRLVQVPSAVAAYVEAGNPAATYWTCGCPKGPQQFVGPHGYDGIKSYDTDWAATGPLIERYGIALRPHDVSQERWPSQDDISRIWEAKHPEGHTAVAKTPMGAVCELIVSLHDGPFRSLLEVR